MKALISRISLALVAAVALLAAPADEPWTWAGPHGAGTMSMIIIGDVDIQLRPDPTTAFVHILRMRRDPLVFERGQG